VAVRAEEPQVLQAIVSRITVHMINLEDQGFAVPLWRLTALRAEPRNHS